MATRLARKTLKTLRVLLPHVTFSKWNDYSIGLMALAFGIAFSYPPETEIAARANAFVILLTYLPYYVWGAILIACGLTLFFTSNNTIRSQVYSILFCIFSLMTVAFYTNGVKTLGVMLYLFLTISTLRECIVLALLEGYKINEDI